MYGGHGNMYFALSAPALPELSLYECKRLMNMFFNLQYVTHIFNQNPFKAQNLRECRKDDSKGYGRIE